MKKCLTCLLVRMTKLQIGEEAERKEKRKEKKKEKRGIERDGTGYDQVPD